MNPFNHTDTILASLVNLDEAKTGSSHLPVVRSLVTVPANFDGGDSNFIPEGTAMTTIFKTSTFTDAERELSDEPTTGIASESELTLVGRLQIEEESTPATREADQNAEIRRARNLRIAENKAEATGHAHIYHEAPLFRRDYTALNELAGYDALDDVLEEQEAGINLGLRVLENRSGDAFLTLTTDGSYIFELTLRHAEEDNLLEFSRLVNDFASYDRQTERNLRSLCGNVRSTGWHFDSRGFEALVWQDVQQRSFVRHCLNVARALGFALYVDRPAEQRCIELSAESDSGVTTGFVAPRSIAADEAPEWHTEDGELLTAVYGYAESERILKAVETPVKPVTVVALAETALAKGIKAKVAAQAKAVVAEVQVAAQPKAVVAEVPVTAPTTPQPGAGKSKKARQRARKAALKLARSRFLKPGEEVLMKVLHFANDGAILKDELGNEGFLGFVGTVNGGIQHSRLVVVPGDEVKVVVTEVSDAGFAQTRLLYVVNPINHYLTCLQVGDIQLGVVMRRRTQHCFYVRLGGPIDGILAVRNIRNLPEVKDKLEPFVRIQVRVTSVNPEKRKFHVEIVSSAGAK